MLLVHTKTSKHLHTVWEQTHIVDKMLGGLAEAPSKRLVIKVGECGLTAALVTEGMKGGAEQQTTGTCPAVWDGWVVTVSFNKWMMFNKRCPSESTGMKKKICSTLKIQRTPGRDLTYTHTQPCWIVKGTNVLLCKEHTVTHFQFKDLL